MKTPMPDQREALDNLRRYLKPGDTLYTIVKHVSRSGMQRSIAAYAIPRDSGEPQWLSGYVARAGLARLDSQRDANVVHGCGMDMGFALTYELARLLWPEGFGCIGDGRITTASGVYAGIATATTFGPRCPSNDHSNGDRDYTPHNAVPSKCPSGPGVPCWCHGEPTAFDNNKTMCSLCGCAPKAHWHRDGGYALRSKTL